MGRRSSVQARACACWARCRFKRRGGRVRQCPCPPTHLAGWPSALAAVQARGWARRLLEGLVEERPGYAAAVGRPEESSRDRMLASNLPPLCVLYVCARWCPLPLHVWERATLAVRLNTLGQPLRVVERVVVTNPMAVESRWREMVQHSVASGTGTDLQATSKNAWPRPLDTETGIAHGGCHARRTARALPNISDQAHHAADHVRRMWAALPGL